MGKGSVRAPRRAGVLVGYPGSVLRKKSPSQRTLKTFL